MSFDVETVLVRELHEVADGRGGPRAPAAAERDNRSRPVWQPLLVAAAVVLIVLGAVAAVTALGGGERELQPAPVPVPDRGHRRRDRGLTDEAVSTAPPTIPYVSGTGCTSAASRSRDDWAWVTGTGTHWIGGRLRRRHLLVGVRRRTPTHRRVHQPTAGRSLPAAATGPDSSTRATTGLLTGADTESGGEGFGRDSDRVPSPRGLHVRVAAVTDEGMVITGATGSSSCGGHWSTARPSTSPAPLRARWSSGTPRRGLVVDATSAESTGRGELYLVDITAEGEITRAAVPCRTRAAPPPAATGSPGSSRPARRRGSPSSTRPGPAHRRQRRRHAHPARGLAVRVRRPGRGRTTTT